MKKRSIPRPPKMPKVWTKKLYAKYLMSNWWKYVRIRKLLSRNFQCDRCNQEATQVHHCHYCTLGREKDCDLEALCKACHRKHHGIK